MSLCSSIFEGKKYLVSIAFAALSVNEPLLLQISVVLIARLKM